MIKLSVVCLLLFCFKYKFYLWFYSQNENLKDKQSDKNVICRTVRHIEYLEKSWTHDDKKENTQQPWTNLRSLFFFLNNT